MGVKVTRLSECLSLAVVLAPSFQRLLTGSAGYESAEVADAALAIVGWAPSADSAFVAQLITNVIDADKLDYMARDAHHAGLPIDFDTERLISKLEALRVEENVLSPRLHDRKEQIRASKDTSNNNRYGSRPERLGLIV